MFGLFGKKKESLTVHDKIWITEKVKFDACINFKRENVNIVLIAWFEETRNNLEEYFKENNLEVEIHLTDRLSLMDQGKELIFVEHHPLQIEEQRIAQKLGVKEITVLSSISEPLFKLFGGDKIVDLMRNMGMKEDEMIEHDMISKSIIRAQEKIAQKSTQNVSAKSQADWLKQSGHNLSPK